MTSDRSNDSSFDALWDFDLEDDKEEIPPALDPRGRRAPISEEDRDTLLPPVPPGEYVETMMQLGELDDPPNEPPPRRGSAFQPFPPPTPKPPRATSPEAGDGARRLGLVLAPESEIMLPTGSAEREPAIADSALITPDRSAPRGPAPRPRPVTSGGFRALGGPRGGLPIPRAPSEPPSPPSQPDPLAGLTFDAFDAFDALDALDAPPRAADHHPASDRSGSVTRPRPTPSPGNRENPSTSHTTGTGLRLHRTGPPQDDDEADRVTPVANDPSVDSDPRAGADDAPSSAAEHLREMVARFDGRNYGGALVLAESVLVGDPDNPVARRVAEGSRDKLGEKYLSSLGGKDGVPRVAMSPDEMRDLSLDHRAGFLLSFIDGSMSVEEVLDVSCMPALDALRMMFELRQQGAIEIDEPPPRPARR